MAVLTRKFNDAFEIESYTPAINDLGNQYGLLNGSGLFEGEGVYTDTITFEKETQTNTLLPQTSRYSGQASKGNDRKNEIFAIPLPYFKHQDAITPRDLQNKKLDGSPDAAQTLANAVDKKMTDMRIKADQTIEYMKIEALKGVTKDPEQNTLADMLTLFGLSRTTQTIDFALGTASTDVDGKISQLRRSLAKGAGIGSAIGGIEVICDPEFFDKLIRHKNIRDAYQYYTNTGRQLLRDDLSRFERWGVVDTFFHKGVLFYSYDATFDLPNGTMQNAFNASEGYTIVNGVRDLYRGNYAPADTLSDANTVGQEMYLTSYRDPRDKFIELELEMAPLYYMTRPQLSWRVHSSN